MRTSAGAEARGSYVLSFSGASYDPETLVLLTRAFNAAWVEVEAGGVSPSKIAGMRYKLAARIMVAADRGERDHARLKAAALSRVDA